MPLLVPLAQTSSSTSSRSTRRRRTGSITATDALELSPATQLVAVTPTLVMSDVDERTMTWPMESLSMTTLLDMDMEAVLMEALAHMAEAAMVAEIRATAVARATEARADTEVKADMASRATVVPDTKCPAIDAGKG